MKSCTQIMIEKIRGIAKKIDFFFENINSDKMTIKKMMTRIMKRKEIKFTDEEHIENDVGNANGSVLVNDFDKEL